MDQEEESHHLQFLQSIQLFAVTKSSVLQKYGADAILMTFMDGIKSLEEV